MGPSPSAVPCYFEPGAYALFFLSPMTGCCASYTTALGALLAYDESHRSSLYETLEAYLCHDGSLKGTAAQLYTHRTP